MIDNLILRGMLTPAFKDRFALKAITILKPDYFDEGAKQIVQAIHDYYSTHNKFPTLSALLVDLGNMPLSEGTYTAALEKAEEIKDELTSTEVNDDNWFLNETQKYCQDKAIHNAIMDSMAILNGTNKKLPKSVIPELLQQALSIEIERSLGHDYLDDAEERYKFLHMAQYKAPFRLATLNKITNGGFAKKTFNVFLAGTHAGKTLMMCSLAADYLITGKNILYITFEMGEEEIAKRIDANLMDVAMDDLDDLPLPAYTKKMENIRSKTIGKMKIKEYPMGGAHVGHFKSLLKEYELKDDFIPDVIFVDYLGICGCQRATLAQGSYVYLKTISEELRGFGQEFDKIMISAGQLNRTGFGSSEPDMTDTAESFGVNFTGDFVATVFADDNMKAMNQLLVIQQKNRYKDHNYMKKFIMGIDRPKMRLYDVENPNQGISSSTAPHTASTTKGNYQSKPSTTPSNINKPNSIKSGAGIKI